MKELSIFNLKNKSNNINGAPRIGDVCILKEANVPRNRWKLARIVEVIESKDGKIRCANCRKANGGIVKRAVNQFIRIESDD